MGGFAGMSAYRRARSQYASFYAPMLMSFVSFPCKLLIIIGKQ